MKKALLIALLTCVACRSGTSVNERAPSAQASSEASPMPSAPLASVTAPNDAGVAAPPALEPLRAEAPLVPLEVPKFRTATVSLPLGATEKRPVVVALHGNYDRPEWQCEVWREITQGFPFVLCPRGIPRAEAPKSEDRWTYGAPADVERELLAALEVLREKYPNHADIERVVYTGFSLGAIYGRGLLSKHPDRFERAVFTEGGYDGWSAPFAKKLAEGGFKKLLLACGQTACVHAGKGVSRVLEKSGIEVRVVSGGNIGHTYDGPVAKAIASEWAWLTEGDPRFKR